jgi:hypothetical protein
MAEKGVLASRKSHLDRVDSILGFVVDSDEALHSLMKHLLHSVVQVRELLQARIIGIIEVSSIFASRKVGNESHVFVSGYVQADSAHSSLAALSYARKEPPTQHL